MSVAVADPDMERPALWPAMPAIVAILLCAGLTVAVVWTGDEPSVTALGGKAAAAVAGHDDRTAILYYRHLLAIEPTQPAHAMNLAMAIDRVGRRDEAIAVLNGRSARGRRRVRAGASSTRGLDGRPTGASWSDRPGGMGSRAPSREGRGRRSGVASGGDGAPGNRQWRESLAARWTAKPAAHLTPPLEPAAAMIRLTVGRCPLLMPGAVGKIATGRTRDSGQRSGNTASARTAATGRADQSIGNGIEAVAHRYSWSKRA